MYRYPRLQNNTESVEKEEYPVPGPPKEPVWWMSWEFYLLILLAVGLRFYRIDTAQYMTDHTMLYQMAHDAVAHGLWPISANGASTGLLLPPLFVYIMMIPATITPNPMAGNVLIALWNVTVVLLTYLFVRRYYGRLAGAITALLYATAANVIVFSRDIWQPDMLPLCAVLLLFLLFRGVVERKPYWFLPSILLIGVMYQFHSTAVYLVALLLVAVILGFKTLRWWELPLAILGFLLLFAPYLYLEYRTHLADIRILFHVARRQAFFNGDVLRLYRMFVSSYVFNPLRQHDDTHLIASNNHSILLTTPLHGIAQFDPLESRLMEVLLVAGIGTFILRVLWPGRSPERRRWFIRVQEWLAFPWRRGLLLLLVWQGTALFFLRHSTFVYSHYLLYLIPGPFIIIGILLSTLVKWAQPLSFPWEQLVRYGVYAMVGLIVLMQTVGSAGWLIDHANGNFNSNAANPQYFDLATIQRIVNTTDQLAQQRHLAHVYIDIHGDDEAAVSYLAQFAHTPMEVLDSAQCLVVPSVQSGPVVYVTDPNRPDIDALLQHYTTATQVGEIEHPGGMPFKLYILSTRPEIQRPLQLSGGVQLLSQQADIAHISNNQKMLMTRWGIKNTYMPQSRTVYNYVFFLHHRKFNRSGTERICHVSRTWTGDELIPFYGFNGNISRYLAMGIETFISAPQHYDHGALKMVVFNYANTPSVTLHTTNGNSLINLFAPTINTQRQTPGQHLKQRG